MEPEIFGLVQHPFRKDRQTCNPVGSSSFLKVKWLYQSCKFSSQIMAGDIYHGMCNFNIPVTRGRHSTVLTVHDLIPLRAGSKRSKQYWQLLALLPVVLRKADIVLTVSRWTESELIRMFPFTENKVQVIPCGLDGIGRDLHFFEKRKMILSVSRWENYKNFELIPKVLAQLGSDWTWVVVTDRLGHKFLQACGSQWLQSGRLRVLSGLSDFELGSLYDRAAVLFHPSDYEGFCLPVAEAQSSGAFVFFKPGSGIDEVADTRMSYGLTGSDDLADLFENVWERVQSADWMSTYREYLNSRRCWSDSAKELVSVYNLLR